MTPSAESGASLFDAKYRLLEASKRLNELVDIEQEIKTHLAASPPRLTMPIADANSQEPVNVSTDWSNAFDHNLTRVARLKASEAIHHLRTALEYLAYAVVWLDTGKPSDRTEFPMVHKSKDWREKVRTRLPGISADHEAMFKRVQPFKHCRWTVQLQDLSNTDKHRHVIGFNPVIQFKSTPGKGTVDSDDPTMLVLDVTDTDAYLELGGFDNPAIPALNQLLVEAVHFVNSFGPSFGDLNHLKVNV